MIPPVQSPLCRALWLAALTTGLVAGPSPLRAAEDPDEFRQCVQVRTLSPEKAAAGLSARLRGVVTYAEPQAGMAFLQDETGGVMLTTRTDAFRALKAGILAEVRGVTGQGGFSSKLVVTDSADIQLLGQASFPEPLRLNLEELQYGGHDSQWIELRGVVRSTAVRPFNLPGVAEYAGEAPAGTRAQMAVNTAQGRYSVIVPWEEGKPFPEGFFDAAVRVQGVLGSIVNSRGQWVGLLVYTPSLDQMRIERPPSGKPFETPCRNVTDLLKSSPEAHPEERVRITGTVLLTYPDYFAFLKTPDATIEVHSGVPATVAPGDVVEAAGYPLLQNKRVILEDCLVRVTGRERPPEPLRAEVGQIMENDLHGELVRIEGELVQNTKRQGDLLLILNCDGQSVEASVPVARLGTEAAKITSLLPGSRLELTGVSQVLGAMDWGGYVRPQSFRLLLGRSADVVLLAAPPWWTPARLLGLIVALAAALGLVAAWVIVLRRQVLRQTRIIREKVEREAIWRDRSRIAQDIHDDLGASLTQVGFLSQRVQASRNQPEQARELANRIADLARATLRALDEIVWAVNPRHDSLQSLADYLVKLASEQFSLNQVRCLLDVPPVLPEIELRAELRHNLALAVKEALHNVVKHAAATEATLALRRINAHLEITIKDNGRGFVPGDLPPTRNGLTNMQNRLSEIGGTCQITSAPAQGTTVRLWAPLTSFKPAPEGRSPASARANPKDNIPA